MYWQRTINQDVEVQGVGLHTGEPSLLRFRPAPPDTGICFVRADLPGRPAIRVNVANVTATQLATTIGGDQFSVATVEHCLSALAALRIDNLVIELNGPEIPIGDGSAQVFLEALKQAGFINQDCPREYLKVEKTIFCGDNSKFARVEPYYGLRITCTIDFDHPQIGRQTLDVDINEYSFSNDIAPARTFGFLKDVEALRSRGLARGGGLHNAIVLDQTAILNKEGLRFQNEFVRHKVLDALGDLVTLGHPLLGHLVLYRAGHDLMNQLVKEILESRDSFRMVALGVAEADSAYAH